MTSLMISAVFNTTDQSDTEILKLLLSFFSVHNQKYSYTCVQMLLESKRTRICLQTLFKDVRFWTDLLTVLF